MITTSIVIGWIVALLCIFLFLYIVYITDLYSDYKNHKKIDKESNINYGYASYNDFLKNIENKLDTLEIDSFGWWERIVSDNKLKDIGLHETCIKIDNNLMIIESFKDYKKYRKYYSTLLSQLRKKKKIENEKKIKERNNVNWKK